VARKRYKKKVRACGLCKPHKTGRSSRWSPRELQRLRQFEQTLQRAGDWGNQLNRPMVLITQSGAVTFP
jgi:hypothetical protein